MLKLATLLLFAAVPLRLHAQQEPRVATETEVLRDRRARAVGTHDVAHEPTARRSHWPTYGVVGYGYVAVYIPAERPTTARNHAR